MLFNIKKYIFQLTFWIILPLLNDLNPPLAKSLIINSKLFIIICPHDIQLQCVKKKALTKATLLYHLINFCQFMFSGFCWRSTLASTHFLRYNTAVGPAPRLISEKIFHLIWQATFIVQWLMNILRNYLSCPYPFCRIENKTHYLFPPQENMLKSLAEQNSSTPQIHYLRKLEWDSHPLPSQQN